MRVRGSVLIAIGAIRAIAGCAQEVAPSAPPAPLPLYPAVESPPERWMFASRWVLEAGAIGRGQSAQPVTALAIDGPPGLAPLHAVAVRAVPDDSAAARAIVAGDGSAELVAIDDGRVLWRAPCAGELAAVTRDVVVCRAGDDLRAIAIADGKPRWQRTAMLLAVTGDRLAVASAAGASAGAAGVGSASGAIEVLAAATDDARIDIALPATIATTGVRATCGDGTELFATTRDGKLARLVADRPTPAGANARVARIAWAVDVGPIVDVDACSDASVRATGIASADASADGGEPMRASLAIVAIARATGAITGRVADVRGAWPSRDADGRIEIATTSGVASWSPDLVGPPRVRALPSLGALIASRGERRLVRVGPDTAALLDARGVRAVVALGPRDAALGEAAIVAATAGAGSPRRFALPPRFARRLRAVQVAPIAPPAELRDLPAATPLSAFEPVATPAPATAHAAPASPPALAALAIDPIDPTALYVAAGSTLARVDVRARTWTWQRGDGCAATRAHASLAIADGGDIVLCAAGAKIVATAADGSPRWSAPGGADGITAGRAVAIAYDGDRARVRSLADGHPLADLASDDGERVRAVAVAAGSDDTDGSNSRDVVISVERGRLVARDPSRLMSPLWARAIDGTVSALSPAGDGALVELADGDAYRVDARTGRVVAVAGIGLAWTTSSDTLAGAAPGGPIPPPDLRWLPPKPTPAAALAARAAAPPPPPKIGDDPPPPIATPWPAPPPMQPSWQLTLYDLDGGVRTRNDYALAPTSASVGSARGPAGSPIVARGLAEWLVIDPATGDPLRRVTLPPTTDALPFSTIVDGAPVSGAVIAEPLRLVLF